MHIYWSGSVNDSNLIQFHVAPPKDQMSLESGDTKQASCCSPSNPSLVDSIVGESKLTIANRGAAVVTHEINGNVKTETVLQTSCTIIHQQNLM